MATVNSQSLKIVSSGGGEILIPKIQLKMAAMLSSSSSITSGLKFPGKQVFPSSICDRKSDRVRCSGRVPNSESTSRAESEPENALLKIAWYGSEFLGIAASVFRSPKISEAPVTGMQVELDPLGNIDRLVVVTAIKQDFARSYFVTGNLTTDAYEENCEFADPAGSFKGLGRFKRNCTNFGSLIQTSHMKLMKWEDFEGKGIGHWRFSCIMSFPWKPILSATGYTEYYFDAKSGKVCRHVEHWNVPKMALFKQLLRPSRGWWRKRTGQ